MKYREKIKIYNQKKQLKNGKILGGSKKIFFREN